MITTKVSVGLEQRRKGRLGCGSTVPCRGSARDPVGEFLLVARMRRASSALVACIMFRIGNTFAGRPTDRDAL